MTKEKIILSITAVLIGLLAASAVFYFYQGTKVIPIDKQKTVLIKPSPTPKPSVLLVIDEPTDEKIYDTRVIKISGKTDPDALIVILTENSEEVLNPTKNGDFSTTITLENGANLLEITAVGKNGDTNTIERTVSFAAENF